MSNEAAQTEEKPATGVIVPPVTSDVALAPAVAVSNDTETTANENVPLAIAPAPQKQPEKGNWFHRHRNFTKEPLTYTGYQFVRSTLATIPYGFGMAFFHHVFGVMSQIGVKMGLTEAGQGEFYTKMKTKRPMPPGMTHLGDGLSTGAAGALSLMEGEAAKSAAELERVMAKGAKGTIGRNLIRLGNSPLNAALQIGLAFSMFRFTGGIVKGLRDKIMDEKNTPEDTNRETKNWWQSTKEMMKVNWKAEATGTFWGALTLGFIGATVQQTMPYHKLPGEANKWQAIKRVLSKPSKLLQNAAIWAISYATFFEVDERIQKDVKLRQGTWKGSSNSLTNGPSDTTGEPPSNENGREKGQEDHKPVAAFFTHDPGLPRLWFRRVLPVAVGIAGYAVMKRSMYVMGGGQMAPITDEINTVGKHAGIYLKNAWKEGLATATFGVLWMATDAWATWYDKFFQKLQDKSEHKPLNEHQSANHAELLSRLNEKAQGQGRAA